MNACEFTLSITALANAIAKIFDNDQLQVLGAAFTQLGDTLATISAQREFCGPPGKTGPETQKGESTA